MKAIALLFLSGAAFAADHAVIVEAKAPNGAVIQLHDSAGPCVDGARLATYVSPDGKTRVPGCHKINADAGIVGIGWFDGDSNAIPVRVFKAPEGV